MSHNKRIFRLAVLVLVSLLHGAVLLLWSRQKPADLPPNPAPQVIPVLVQEVPVHEEKPKEAEAKKPVPKPRQRAERAPHRKTLFRRPSQEQTRHQSAVTGSFRTRSAGTSPYGIWQVQPWRGGGQSALGLFMRGLDCARLSPQYGRLGCPPEPVNLVQGMEDKIAAIAALEARGIRSPHGPRLFRHAASDHTHALVGNTNTGLATSAQDTGAIPPLHPDPSFGD